MAAMKETKYPTTNVTNLQVSDDMDMELFHRAVNLNNNIVISYTLDYKMVSYFNAHGKLYLYRPTNPAIVPMEHRLVLNIVDSRLSLNNNLSKLDMLVLNKSARLFKYDKNIHVY